MKIRLSIVDVSDPVHPSRVGGLRTAGARGIVIDRSYPAVADIHSGLAMLDLRACSNNHQKPTPTYVR